MNESDESQVEALLARCLQSPPEHWSAALEDTCRAHPALAEDLRRRWKLLEGAGLVEPRDGAGEEFGDFRLLGQLGGGAMGIVYAAWWVPGARLVALKLLRPGRLSDGEARARFRREMELTAKLHHPALVEVHAVGEHEGTPYLAMRLVEGETLAARLARPDGVPAGEEAVRATVQRFAAVARGLQLAHEQGLVHRDVKPANMMVTPAGEAVLLDFGLAHRGDSDSTRWTDPAARVGTPAYMAPELIEGAAPDASADVYSLGATLYEALTGVRPFAAPTLEATLRRATSEPPPDPRRINRAVTRDLALVVRTALARRSAERYASAGDFARDLEAVLVGGPVRARRTGLLLATWRWARDIPLGTLVGAVAVLVAGVLGWRWRGALQQSELIRAILQAETPKENLRAAYAAWEDSRPNSERWSHLQEALAGVHLSRTIPLGEKAWALAYGEEGALLVGAGEGLWIVDAPFDSDPREWGVMPWVPTALADLSWREGRGLVHERGKSRRLALVDDHRRGEELSENALAAALTPGGARWIELSSTGALALCWRDAGGERGRTELEEGVGAAIAPMSGRTLVWNDEGDLSVWKDKGLARIARVRPHGSPPVGAACSADGGFFITGSERKNRGKGDLAQLWSLGESGEPRPYLLDDVAPVAWAEFTAGGALVWARHEDGRLRAWNPRGTSIWTEHMEAGDQPFLTGGVVAMASRNGRLKLLSLVAEGVVAELPNAGRPVAVAAPPTGFDEIAVLDEAGQPAVWRVTPGRGHLYDPPGRKGLVGAWPVEAGMLVMDEAGLLTRFGLDGVVKLQRELVTVPTEVRGAAFAAAEGRVYFALREGELRSFELETRGDSLVHDLRQELSGSWEFAIGSDGGLAACDPAGRVWREGSEGLECPGRPQALARAGSSTAAGGASSEGKGWIRVWRDGALIEDRSVDRPVTTLQLSSDAELLLIGCGEREAILRRVDGLHGKVNRVRIDLGAEIYCAAFDTSGERLAVGLSDGCVELYDGIRTPAPGRVGVLRGHRSSVREVTFDKGGLYLVSASYDGTARRWPVTDGELSRLAKELLGED